jgi:hypothetical protein
MSRCTKMGPGGNTTTNSNNYNFNKYNGGGIGASSIANRNAKNKVASFCKTGCTSRGPSTSNINNSNAQVYK